MCVVVAGSDRPEVPVTILRLSWASLRRFSHHRENPQALIIAFLPPAQVLRVARPRGTNIRKRTGGESGEGQGWAGGGMH